MHSPPWWPHKQQSMTLSFLHIECLQKQHYTGNADFCWILSSNLMLSDYLSSDFQIVWVGDLGKIQKQHSLNREPLEVVSFWRISFENVFRVYNLGSLTDWVSEISEIPPKRVLDASTQSPTVILNDISNFNTFDPLCLLFLIINQYFFYIIAPFSISYLNCPPK